MTTVVAHGIFSCIKFHCNFQILIKFTELKSRICNLEWLMISNLDLDHKIN